MGPQVVPVFFQAFNNGCKTGVAVKVSGKKEGRGYVVLSQGFSDDRVTICKLMAGEDQRQLFLRGVPPDYGPLVPGYFFFIFLTLPFSLPSIWSEESRKLRLAVPSMVGSLVE